MGVLQKMQIQVKRRSVTQLTSRVNTYFYDGGRNDWQLDGSLPVDINKDKGSKPDSKNDYK